MRTASLWWRNNTCIGWPYSYGLLSFFDGFFKAKNMLACQTIILQIPFSAGLRQVFLKICKQNTLFLVKRTGTILDLLQVHTSPLRIVTFANSAPVNNEIAQLTNIFRFLIMTL